MFCSLQLSISETRVNFPLLITLLLITFPRNCTHLVHKQKYKDHCCSNNNQHTDYPIIRTWIHSCCESHNGTAQTKENHNKHAGHAVLSVIYSWNVDASCLPSEKPANKESKHFEHEDYHQPQGQVCAVAVLDDFNLCSECIGSYRLKKRLNRWVSYIMTC